MVCPACRTRRDGDLHLFTVEPEGAAALRCQNQACARRYPVIDGVPLVVPDVDGCLAGQAASVEDVELDLDAGAARAAAGPDDAPHARLVEHLSTYLDAHWGDRAEPTPSPRFGMDVLAARLGERARAAPVEAACELGASVGRGLAELARGARRVTGIELHLGAIRRARRLLAGEPLRYLRREIGRTYSHAVAQAGDLAPRGVTLELACADALDPPLAPDTFDRVVALNVIDSVAHPRQLLAVMDGLLRAGGELILSSPYAWQSGVVDEDERLGGADPAAEVARLVRERGYAIEDEAELPWTLRRDARAHVEYRVHWLRARRA